MSILDLLQTVTNAVEAGNLTPQQLCLLIEFSQRWTNPARTLPEDSPGVIMGNYMLGWYVRQMMDTPIPADAPQIEE